MTDNFSQFDKQEELAKALQLLEKGKLKKGEKMIKKIIKNFPDFLPARLTLADFLLEMMAPFEALNILREGMKTDSENLDLRYLYAISLQKCWFLNLAEKEFKFLKERDPKNPEILRQFGWTKVLKGKVEEGRGLLREAINLNLMDPLAYMDLGASYAMSLDFAESLNWMETARNLDTKNPFISEKIEETKKMEREFEKFSEKDKRKMRQMRKNSQELKLMAIETMFLLSREIPLTREDYQDLKEEIKLAGFSPKMTTLRPPKTKEEKTTIEYMEYHYKVPDVERKISKKEFEKIKEKLFNPETKEKEFKKLLLILAHQGTKEAIKLLEDCFEKASGELEDWVRLALEECKIFSQAKPGQVVKIMH